MSITRQNVADYLNGQFSILAATVGQSATPATGYGPDIDNALRELGKAESEIDAATIEDSSRNAYFALAEFFAAQRFWRQLGGNVNHTMGETSFNFTDQRANAKAMMDAAADKCFLLGYNVDARKERKALFKVY